MDRNQSQEIIQWVLANVNYNKIITQAVHFSKFNPHDLRLSVPGALMDHVDHKH